VRERCFRQVRHHLAKLKLQVETGILTSEGQKHLNLEVVVHEKHAQVGTIDKSNVACRTKEN